jgi:cytochrome P450
MGPDAPTIDLVSPASFDGGQPHEQFRWLREHDPVHWHAEPDGAGFWAVTRYHDVKEVGRDPQTYSSYAGGIMIPDTDDEALAAPRQMMLYMDPPEHTRYRKLVSAAFTPRNAARWTQRIDALATDIVDQVCEQGACDLATDLAGEMPSALIAELMGIPRDDGRRLYVLTERMHAAPGAVDDGARLEAAVEMLTYAGEVAAAKRRSPGDDLASVLAGARVDGDELTDEEFCWFFLLLINAGGDTTRNLLGGGAQVLFDEPEQRAWLQADLHGRVDTAVEELLRVVSPVVHMRRTATRDTVLGGRSIRAGDKVVMFYGSANRDAMVFADPDRVDLGRAHNPHVAFGGGGPHYCLGAHFARAEARAMLVEVLGRLPDLEPDGEPEWLASNFICGPTHLPVRFTPAPRAHERRAVTA